MRKFIFLVNSSRTDLFFFKVKCVLSIVSTVVVRLDPMKKTRNLFAQIHFGILGVPAVLAGQSLQKEMSIRKKLLFK
jgi:hypothetical protein